MKLPLAGRVAVALLVMAVGPLLPGAQTAPYDVVIRNARILDGTGNPWFLGAIGIRGDRIASVVPATASSGMQAAESIDARGQVVSPGFIDIHTHARRGIFEVPTADNYVRQGVTTVIEGPDGSSPLPLGAFLAKLAATPRSVNVGSFAGQGSIREAVIGSANRVATAEERAKMRAMVEQAMKEGAFGLSTGLFYVPGTFTPTDEVVELAAVAGRLGGIHISHMRDEASRVVDSVKETIAIGENGHLPTQVTHHKIIGRPNWGRSAETLGLIDAARARGVDATIDQYPYTASSTSIQSALLPAWALEGTRADQMARLKDPASRAKIRGETVRLIATERGGGDPRNVALASCQWDQTMAGKTLADVAARRGFPATIEGAANATLWIVEQGGCQGIFHAIDENDLQRILRHPATMIASDGEVPIFGRASPHPRSYGTFARVLAVYVRERGTLTLADAVRRMSAFPAQRLGLHDRGVLRPGMKADLVIFDPDRVRDTATFERPHQYAEGFTLVITNGQIVYRGGNMTAARPGVVLYGPAYGPDTFTPRQ
jgi:N-acyl-D-amino-acid deacylase